MAVVILLSRRLHINPDNIATPIAASLGDLTTISLLAAISMFLFKTLGRFACFLSYVSILSAILYRGGTVSGCLTCDPTRPGLCAFTLNNASDCQANGLLSDYRPIRWTNGLTD